MVGSLKLVGEGKWTAIDLRRRLTDACGPVAPLAAFLSRSITRRLVV